MSNACAILATSAPVTLTSAPAVAAGPPNSAGYTYEANGNRLTGEGSTYTISSTSNRLSGISGALTRTYSYDNSGNTTGDGSATFAYNDAGRMVSATKAAVTTTYALNALGQRVKKTTSGSSRYFVYDEAGHLVGEYGNSGALIQETVWFGDVPVAVLKPNGSGVDVFYVHTDHLNTPRRISRPSDNAIVWRWDSGPFGTTAANEDPDGDSSLFAYGLRFPGNTSMARRGCTTTTSETKRKLASRVINLETLTCCRLGRC
jgi:YD repeat-containing protein